MDGLQPKLIYLARRHPSLTREQFQARWRRHARLGMSLPRWVNIERYVHCDIVPPGKGFETVLGDQDGVGLIWHRSTSHRRAHLADTRSRLGMELDEAETFSEPIANVCLVAQEVVVRPPAPRAPWKLTRFAETTESVVCPAGALGHVRNEPLPPESGSTWGLKSGLVDEFWFESREAAELGATELTGASVLVLSTETQLYP